MSCTTATSPEASAEQLELFPVPGSRVVISYARPDGGALTDADFEHLARLARPVTSRKSG
ncbi:hypothetical protein [Streptomyces anulatus]|uniref:hypothetical protein n=1 Tax=Streptomyces anulatus TaxID=1892 RepID=UPI002E0D475E|nr:hypothetical protein OG274_38100 [Streptomyces anulatus]